MTEKIINLGERRRVPVESYTVQFNRYHMDEKPEVSVIGLGSDIAELDLRRLTRDLAYAAISMSNCGRAETGHKREHCIAMVSMDMDGAVHVSAEMTLFRSDVDRRWFTENLTHAAKILEALIRREQEADDPPG